MMRHPEKKDVMETIEAGLIANGFPRSVTDVINRGEYILLKYEEMYKKPRYFRLDVREEKAL